MENKMGKGIVSGLLSIRANIVELITVAVIIAFAINILASGLLGMLKLSPEKSIIIGLALTILGTFFLINRSLGNEMKIQKLEPFFVYHKVSNEILLIPRYEFSWTFNQFLNAGFNENRVLETIWNKEPLSKAVDVDDYEHNGSAQIITEAVEYYILSKLSTHLTDYFGVNSSFKESNLCRLSRVDIPDVLLKNRFMELFTKPLLERQSFIDEYYDEEDIECIYVAWADDGAYYEKFDLILPKNSRILRRSPNVIEIETPKFKLSFNVTFDGIGTVLPRDFKKRYLSTSVLDTSTFKIKIIIEVEFKRFSLLSSSGWDYFKWIDSFLEDIDEEVSKERFFAHLGWDHALTVLELCEKTNADMYLNPERDKANPVA